MTTGRFAPSPTGELHLGNLRTALVAWLAARSQRGRFVLRFDDLDAASARDRHVADQIAALTALGIDWDPPVVRQSDRRAAHDDAIAELLRRADTFECYCSRREIREAINAPNGPDTDGRYPGTCRRLTTHERAARQAEGRPPALRLRADEVEVEVDFVDRVAGSVSGVVGDLVLRRNDGAIAYNVAVVVDDVGQGVTEVVRGDDLVPATAGQIHLARLLGLDPPAYAHVPLVLGPDGRRLAKRDGAVTLRDLEPLGVTPQQVVGRLAHSLGLTGCDDACDVGELVAGFDFARIGHDPWRFDPKTWSDRT